MTKQEIAVKVLRHLPWDITGDEIEKIKRLQFDLVPIPPGAKFSYYIQFH